MSYQVLARKYRPTSFDEVIGQDHVVRVIKNSIEQERVHQAFLFSGTRGVGKTTIARLLAKCLNCMSSDSPTSQPCNKCDSSIAIQEGKSIDFLEIDAASRTGVDHMRELLSSIYTSPSVSRFKIFLIDEVHVLSRGSFNALLKTLEEPPSHVIFLLATTDPEKIPKTVISRCLQLNLKTVSRIELEEHFRKICEKEAIKSDDGSGGTTSYLKLDGSATTTVFSKNIVITNCTCSVFISKFEILWSLTNSCKLIYYIIITKSGIFSNYCMLFYYCASSNCYIFLHD